MATLTNLERASLKSQTPAPTSPRCQTINQLICFEAKQSQGLNKLRALALRSHLVCYLATTSDLPLVELINRPPQSECNRIEVRNGD